MIRSWAHIVEADGICMRRPFAKACVVKFVGGHLVDKALEAHVVRGGN